MARKDRKEKEKVSLFQRMKRYFQGVRSELRRVIWPTREELKTYTLIVLGVSLSVALITGLFDMLFSQILLSWL